MFVSLNSNTTGATGTAFPSGDHEFSPGFQRDSSLNSNTTGVTENAFLSGDHEFTPGFQRDSSCSMFSFLCNVLYLIACSLTIILFVLHFTTFDNHFGIFKPFLLSITRGRESIPLMLSTFYYACDSILTTPIETEAMHSYHFLPIDNNNYKDMFKRYPLAIAFYVIVRLKASDYPPLVSSKV